MEWLLYNFKKLSILYMRYTINIIHIGVITSHKLKLGKYIFTLEFYLPIFIVIEFEVSTIDWKKTFLHLNKLKLYKGGKSDIFGP